MGKQYGYIGVGLVILSLLSYLYMKNIILEKEVAQLTADKIIAEVNNERLQSTIQSQNEAIEAISADYEGNLKKLRELENQPPKERFRVIYETIPSLEVESDECNDIKKLIDDIRTAGY